MAVVVVAMEAVAAAVAVVDVGVVAFRMRARKVVEAALAGSGLVARLHPG